MAVAFRANGTTAASATADITPGLPAAYAAADILLLWIESDGASNWQLDTATVAAGWELLFTLTGPGATTQLGLAWLRAPNTSVVAPTVLRNTSNHVLAVVQAFSGAIASGNAAATFDGLGTWGAAAGSGSAVSSIAVVAPAGTDSTAEMIVVAEAFSNTAGGGLGVPVNANLTSPTTWLNANTSLGNAGAISIGGGIRATAGPVGTTTVAVTGSPDYVGVVFGIRAIAPVVKSLVETASATDTLTPLLYARWDYLPSVISQYRNSPILLALMEYCSQWFDQDFNVNQFYVKMWNIATAEGYGLDVWGRIVGVGRTLQVLTGTNFEFQQQTQTSPLPFGGGPFYAGVSPTTNYTLSDDAYRQLILAKALSNVCNGSIPAINKILMFLFPGLGNCYVTDGLNMTMTYTFGSTLSAVQLAIVSQTGILPRPVGVAATIVNP